jgi:lipopolysaccharide/colanic/teichoic acid biosynthesis glycosyltransferase
MLVNEYSRTRYKTSHSIALKDAPSSPSCHCQNAGDDVRRLGDQAIACTLLAITLPLLLLVWFAIKCDSPGPALEARERISRGGRRFRTLVFRTTAHQPGRPTSAWAAQQTTRVGSFLRYTRIEALPQLINVLRGDIPLTETSLFD